MPELDIRGILGELVAEDVDDLLMLKEQAGRPEDLTDLERLRQARDE